MDPVILSTAFFFGYFAYRLNLPPLVGFLLAGLSLNLFGFSTSPVLQAASELGVTLLLFTIGLKLDLRNLMKPEVFGAASIHMGLSTGLLGFIIFLIAHTGLSFFTGLDLQTAMLLGFGLSFSSTVFAVKLLEERGRMDSLNGRIAIGVLIIQDLIAVAYLTLSTGKVPSLWAILVLIALPFAQKIFMRIMDRVGHGELQVLFGLVLALSLGAAMFDLVGLKADLGALILGVLIAPHPRAKEIAKQMMSIKDLFLIGFFLDIGLTGLPNFSGISAVLLFLLLLPLKVLLYFVIFTRFRLKARTSMLATMNLANFSEFGLIVCAMAVANGNLNKEWLVVMAIALSISMIIASLINSRSEYFNERYGNTLKKLETVERHPEEQPYEVGTWQIAVFGMGRVGMGAYDIFRDRFGDVVVGIDYDPVTVGEQVHQKRRIVQADVTDMENWDRFQIHKSTIQLVILAMPCLDAKLKVVNLLKMTDYKGTIASVALYDDEVESLKEAGVDIAYNMYSEAGAGLAGHIYDQIAEREIGANSG